MDHAEERRQKAIEQATRTILEAIGEDVTREGLLDTPKRVAKMYAEVFSGLGKTAEDILSVTFALEGGGEVIERDIPFYSMCEHHLLPFWGKAHIAYLPKDRVAGLSKLARTVELYAKKPQLQERLTKEIAEAIMRYLGAQGALVMVEAEHMCMNMRGVKKPGTKTVTTLALGRYAEDADRRRETLMLLSRGL